jgi:hypothetical protein
MLGGRPFAAADLYKRGFAPWLLIANVMQKSNSHDGAELKTPANLAVRQAIQEWTKSSRTNSARFRIAR